MSFLSEFEKLKKLLKTKDSFNLILVLTSDPLLRERLIAQLEERNGLKPISLPFQTGDSLDALCGSGNGVSITGTKNSREWFLRLNQSRESIAERCAEPILLWLDKDELETFAAVAPDLWAWRAAVIDLSTSVDIPGSMNAPKRQEDKRKRLAEIEGALNKDTLSEEMRNSLERQKGILLLRSGQIRAGKRYLEEAVERERSKGDAYALASSLTWLGESEFKLESSLKASIYLNEALTLSRELGMEDFQARALIALARVKVREGKLEEALSLASEAAHFSKERDLDYYLQGALNVEVDVLLRMGRKGEALGVIHRRKELAKGSNLPGRLAEAQAQEASILLSQGKLEKALEEFGKAEKGFQEAGSFFSIASVKCSEARILRELGRYKEAREALTVSLELTKRVNNKQGMRVALAELARLALTENRVRESKALYLQVLAEVRKVGDRFGQASVLNSLAQVSNRLGESEDALDYAESAIEVARELKNPIILASSIGAKATTYASLKNWDKAKGLYLEALRGYESSGDFLSATKLLSDIASVSRRQGDFEEAARVAERGVELARERKIPAAEGKALLELGRALRMLEQERAESVLSEAFEIFSLLGNERGRRFAEIEIEKLVEGKKE